MLWSCICPSESRVTSMFHLLFWSDPVHASIQSPQAHGVSGILWRQGRRRHSVCSLCDVTITALKRFFNKFLQSALQEFGLSQLREGAASNSLRSILSTLTLLMFHLYMSVILGEKTFLMWSRTSDYWSLEVTLTLLQVPVKETSLRLKLCSNRTPTSSPA